MQYAVIARILGLLLALFSLGFVPPAVLAFAYSDGLAGDFLRSMAAVLAASLVLCLLGRDADPGDLGGRSGMLVTLLFWVILSLFGALPLWFAQGLGLDFVAALFESTSGLTTTGATVLVGLDEMPRSLLYYRQQLQWLGGIGLAVIAVAVLPALGVGSMQLYRAEVPGPVKDDAKLTPQIAGTGKQLFKIYLGLTIVCALAYWLAGMSAFDAMAHSFSTVAIGGFSTHDASMGYFDNGMILLICMVFMVLSGLNYALHFHALVRRSLGHYVRDPEARLYLIMLMALALVTGAALLWYEELSGGEAWLVGAFQAVSIMTTTGFAASDFSLWPGFIPMLLFVSAFFGACVGSVGGGIKVGRMIILARQSLREVRLMVHPRAVFPVKVGGRLVPQSVADRVWGFFGVYLAIFYALVLLLMATGLDFLSAWSAVAATLNNLGPGLGEVAANYSSVSMLGQGALCLAMLLGRLEIFTLLLVFMPIFWRH